MKEPLYPHGEEYSSIDEYSWECPYCGADNISTISTGSILKCCCCSDTAKVISTDPSWCDNCETKQIKLRMLNGSIYCTGCFDESPMIYEPKVVLASTEGIKFDQGKNRLDLLPFAALEKVGKIMTLGASKYTEDNWTKGMSWRRLSGAALRHLFSWIRGQSIDSESQESHLAHAACCILFLLTYEIHGLGTDDRWIPPKKD